MVCHFLLQGIFLTQGLNSHFLHLLYFPGGAGGKESKCQCRSGTWSLSQEDPLEEGMATHSSILAWRSPWLEQPGRLWSIGLHGIGHNRSNLALTHLPPESPVMNWCYFFFFTHRAAASRGQAGPTNNKSLLGIAHKSGNQEEVVGMVPLKITLNTWLWRVYTCCDFGPAGLEVLDWKREVTQQKYHYI